MTRAEDERAEVEQRVDELAAAHSGDAFALAIRSYFAELEPAEQELLKEILLARAASLQQALGELVDNRGWFQRQWDRFDTSPPRRDERDR